MINEEMFKFFTNETSKRLNRMEDKLEKRFDAIDKKIDKLSGFRWRTVGASSIIVALFSLLIVYFK